MSKIDARIHGSGIVGRALALAFARQALAVGIDAKPVAPAGAPPVDVRAYALNAASVELLRELKVWDGLSADARTPVYDMRVAGDGGGLLAFSAWRQAVP
ncbi:MAG: 2-octaprenyl-3-methyl-6-methoxy-1,4-benzoquinol hydroxylase, partial [Burkholderiaceae bacterium]